MNSGSASAAPRSDVPAPASPPSPSPAPAAGAAPPPTIPSLTTGRARLVTLIVAGSFFMENLDGTVIATALPQMARDFGVPAVNLGIGMTAYLLTLAVFIPVSGWVADRLGARLVFGAAIGVFTFASILCGLSNGLWSFTAARVLQGIGGAMMVPVGRVVVLRSTPKSDLMNAIAYLTWPGLAAPVLGPPVGGFFTTFATWRWIFFLNVPLGLLGIALTLAFIRSPPAEARRPFDPAGFVLGGAGLASLMYGLELVGQLRTPWVEAGLFLAVGLGAGTAALLHARRHPTPLLDLSALRIPTYRLAVLGGSLFRIAIGSAPFLLPLLFQLGFGMDAFASGLLVLALFAGNLSMKAGTTRILRRWGFRTVLVVNGIIAAASLLVCGLLSPDTPKAVIAAVLFLGGLSRSMQFTCINTLGFADVPKPMMSGASTLSSMVQQMAQGLGIAFGSVALHLAVALHGTAGPRLPEFRIAFALVALLALLGVADALGLPRDAGAEVSGHRARA